MKSSSPKNVLALYIPLLIFTSMTILFIRDGHSLYDFPLDDAWIHRIYSHSFLYHCSFDYNSNMGEAGSTSPLWSILTAPCHLLEFCGVDYVILAVKVISFMLGVVVIVGVYFLTLLLGHSKTASSISASIFALEPRLLFSILSGMGTILAIALLIWAAVSFFKEKYLIACILISLAPVSRPETLIFYPLLLFGLTSLKKKKITLGQLFIYLIVLFIPLSAWMLFCKYANGHLLPNTFYIKAVPFSFNIEKLFFLLAALNQQGWASTFFYSFGLIAFVLFLFFSRNKKAIQYLTFLFILPMLYLVAVIGTRQINLSGHYWTRWFDPAILLLTIPFAIGIGFLIVFVFKKIQFENTAKNQKQVILRITTGVLTIIALLFSVKHFTRSFVESRNRLSDDSHVIRRLNVEPGQWLYSNTGQNDIISLGDAGAIKYFSQRTCFDLIGLNNSDIAFKKVYAIDLVKKSDWLVMFPIVIELMGLQDEVAQNFQPFWMFNVPLSEHTVCECPEQSTVIIYKRVMAKE